MYLIRLALITQDFPPETGGIQTYSFELAKHLVSLCDHFVVIAPYKKDAIQFDQSLPYEVVRIHSTNPLLGFNLIPQLGRILKKRKIDYTFHTQWQTLLPAIRLRNKDQIKKCFLAAHGRELLFNPFRFTPFLGKCYQNYLKRMPQKADLIFPVSQYTANILSRLDVSSQKIRVVHNGTDPKKFFPVDAIALSAMTDNSTLKKFNTISKLSDKKILFTICRHVERKGIQDVLAALPNILKSIPNIHYIIGGSGSFTPRLKVLTKKLKIEPHVSFVGRIPDEELNTFYSLCNVFIMTPREVLPDVEGFGIVYLEANACGKAVIGTQSGGVSDAIKDEQTGLLIKSQSISAIENAVVKLMKNDTLRERLGKQGQQLVLEQYNWQIVAQKLFTLMKNN